MFRLKVISFGSYCPHTKTDRHTQRSDRSTRPLKYSVDIRIVQLWSRTVQSSHCTPTKRNEYLWGWYELVPSYHCRMQYNSYRNRVELARTPATSLERNSTGVSTGGSTGAMPPEFGLAPRVPPLFMYTRSIT